MKNIDDTRCEDRKKVKWHMPPGITLGRTIRIFKSWSVVDMLKLSCSRCSYTKWMTLQVTFQSHDSSFLCEHVTLTIFHCKQGGPWWHLNERLTIYEEGFCRLFAYQNTNILLNTLNVKSTQRPYSPDCIPGIGHKLGDKEWSKRKELRRWSIAVNYEMKSDPREKSEESG